MTTLFIYVFLASGLTALANLFIRRSMDLDSRADGGDPFLSYRLMAAAGFIIVFSIIRGEYIAWDSNMIFLGTVSGCLLGALMWTIGHSVKKGPPALSFTFSSAAYIVPPLLMAMVFGKEFGHEYSLQNALGSFLVIGGLFWMGWQQRAQTIGKSDQLRIWLFWLAAAFSVNVLYLTFFQWRALMLKEDLPTSVLLPFQCDPSKGDCFMLAMFITAAILQRLMPGRAKPKSFPVRQVLGWGVSGGVINGISGLMLVRATEIASCSSEKAIIFPMFCVSLIILCNVWGMLLYKEKVNWAANLLCAIGIALGSRT